MFYLHRKQTQNGFIRGKIFETDFQQTPVSGVEVRIRGTGLELSMDALSNANGEYEFGLLSRALQHLP